MERDRLAARVRVAGMLAVAAFLSGCAPGTESPKSSGTTDKGAAVQTPPKSESPAPGKPVGDGVATSSGRRRHGTDAETAQRILDLRYVGERFVAGIVLRPAEIAQTPAGKAILSSDPSDWPGADLFAGLEPRTGLKLEEIDILVRLTDIEQLKAFALRAVPSTAAEGANRPEVPPEVVAASIEQKRRERRRVCQPTIVAVAKQPVDKDALAKRLVGFRERVVHDQAFWESEDGDCVAVPEDRVVVMGRKEALLDSLLGREVQGRLRLLLATTGRHHVIAGVDVAALEEARMYDPILHTLPSSLLAAATFAEPAHAAVASLDLDGAQLLRIRLQDLSPETATKVFEHVENLVLKARADYGQMATAGKDDLPPFLRVFGPVVADVLAEIAVDREPSALRPDPVHALQNPLAGVAPERGGSDVHVTVMRPDAWSRLPELIEQWTTRTKTAAENPPANDPPPASGDDK